MYIHPTITTRYAKSDKDNTIEVQLLLDTERDHYMNLEDIKIEQIKDYIHQEKAEGRTVQEIIKEIVTVRSDVTILSRDSMVAEKQMSEALK